jgi:ABC-type sugar transport system permease subunit/ABC-type glycerol-3-phosphate transport system substrate-binding protein
MPLPLIHLFFAWLVLAVGAVSVVARGVELEVFGPGPLTQQISFLLELFEEENPGVQVVVAQNASRDQTSDPTRFLVSVAGGQPPDLIIFDRYAVAEWAARNAFRPLDDLIEKERARPDGWVLPENFYNAAWEEGTWEGRVYGIPFTVDLRLLFYNRDALASAGYVDERGAARPPRSWSELREMAVALSTTDARGRLLQAGFIPTAGNAHLYLYGWLNGAKFTDASGKPSFRDPRIAEALSYMHDLYDALGGFRQVSAFEQTFRFGTGDPFVNGQVVMAVQTSDYLQVISTFAPDFNWGVAPLPLSDRMVEEGAAPVTWSGGFCFAIPANARNPELAWELIRWLTSEEAVILRSEIQVELQRAQGRMGLVPANPNIRANQLLMERFARDLPPAYREGYRLFEDLIEHSHFRPKTPVGQRMWQEQLNATGQALYGRLTPGEALAEAERNLDEALAQFAFFQQSSGLIRWGIVLPGFGVLMVVCFWLIYKVGGGRLSGEQNQREGWVGYAFAAPWLFGFFFLTFGTMLFTLLISFGRYDLLNPAAWMGGRNYSYLLGDELFWKSLWNTTYMVIGVPLGMGLSLGFAMLVVREIRFAPMWTTLIYLPSIIPMVAASIIWIEILGANTGLLNQMLAMVGIDGPNWLGDARTSKPALIMMGLWVSGGSIIIWIAGLKEIPRTYYEAAELDGAGYWRQFLSVTLPLLTPYILFNLIMGLIGTFRIFDQAYIMTEGGPVNSTLFYAYYLFNHAFRFLNMGVASAMAWILFLIVVVLTTWQMVLSRRWVHYEGD